MRPLRLLTPSFALLTALAAPLAHAEEGGEPLRGNPFLGTSNNFGVEVGVGLSGDEDVDLLSIQPTLSARFRVAESLGIQVVLPMMFVDQSSDTGGDNRFELGNPTIAAEFVLDQNGMAATFVRAGVALPLVSFPDSVDSLAELGDVFLQAANIAMAAGSRGYFDLWRYAPDRLSIFGEILGATDYDSLFMEFGAGAGLLIPTSDQADTEVVLQARARLGYGAVVKPFLGIGLVFIPTETEGLSGDEDAFQFSVQAGAIIKVGEARIEAALNLNIDKPAGFSFDDDGVFGIRVGAQIPF